MSLIGEEVPFFGDERGGPSEPEPSPAFRLDEVLRAGTRDYDNPDETVRGLLDSLPNAELLSFLGLAHEIHEGVMEAADRDTCVFSPDDPDFARTQILDDGQVRIPIADRSTLGRYLDDPNVIGFLDYRWTNLLSEGDIKEGLDDKKLSETPIIPTHPDRKISDLPKTDEAQVMDRDLLFAMVGAYFWSEQPGYIYTYIDLWETLEVIARDIPDSLVLPMLRLIDQDYRKIVDDDDCYEPIIHPIGRKDCEVEDSIVWQRFSITTLREHLMDYVSSDLDWRDSRDFDLQQHFESAVWLSEHDPDADPFGYDKGEAVVNGLRLVLENRHRRKHGFHG